MWPAAAAEETRPGDVGDDGPSPEQLFNQTMDSVKRGLSEARDGLPFQTGNGSSEPPQGGSGSNQSAPPDDPEPAKRSDVVVRIRDRLPDEINETLPPGDEPPEKAAGGLVAGAMEIIRQALDSLFGRPAADSGGNQATVSDYMTTAAQADPATMAVLAAVAAGVSVGLYWMGRRVYLIGLLPLLSRIARSDIYQNDARRLVADLVDNNPGACLHDLVERTGYSRNAVSYHLFVLEKEELITSIKDGKYRRYFTRGGKYVNGAKNVVGVLKNDTSLKIAQFVRDHPGAIQRQVCAGLGTTPSATCWHAKRLEETGLLRKQREGNTVRYFLGPAVEKYDLRDFGLAMPAA